MFDLKSGLFYFLFVEKFVKISKIAIHKPTTFHQNIKDAALIKN